MQFLAVNSMEEDIRLNYSSICHPQRMYDTRFDMSNLPCADTHLFRFTVEEIAALCEHFLLPSTIVTQSRARFDSDEALAISLRRFAYPCRWVDLSGIFHRPISHLCEAFYYICDHIYDTFCHLLDFNVPSINYKFPEFSAKVHWKGGALRTCIGFLDGTFRPMCRPSINQRECFSGHKRSHGLKFQGVKTPDGIIRQLYGPVEGRRHDAFMLRESGLLSVLENEMKLNGVQYCLYGDPAYPHFSFLQVPFAVPSTREQIAYNKSMASVRLAVEWAFKDISSNWAFLDFKKNLKLYLSPVGQWYKVCAILTNCLTCLRQHNETSLYFEMLPPRLEEYLQLRG